MALTQEQQSQVEFQEAMDAGRRTHDLEMEHRRAKLEAVRLAKETLLENSRSKPVDSRDVSAEEINSYANTLVGYINS
jgi:hypothetical protein